jgi:hypothetical protein
MGAITSLELMSRGPAQTRWSLSQARTRLASRYNWGFPGCDLGSLLSRLVHVHRGDAGHDRQCKPARGALPTTAGKTGRNT